MIIVRYADDLIVGFEHENDARRFLDEMRERLQEFALSLHSEKTRLIEFGRLAVANRKRRGLGKPETFTFLGFTFICSKTRRGKFQIKRKSRRDLPGQLEEHARGRHGTMPAQPPPAAQASSAKWVRTKAGHVVVRLRSGADGSAWRCRILPTV
jgi:RNA-directed DNA polymerase